MRAVVDKRPLITRAAHPRFAYSNFGAFNQLGDDSGGSKACNGPIGVPICFSVSPGPETPCRYVTPLTNQKLRNGSLLAVDPLVHVERTPAS